MVPYVDIIGLSRNFMRNLCDAAKMSFDVAALPLQAHAGDLRSYLNCEFRGTNAN